MQAAICLLVNDSETETIMSALKPAAPALNTIRGFGASPAGSGDEDSDYCPTPPLTRRGRGPRLDDVVSANCSPVLRGTNSPAVSGIAKLRMQMEPLSLNDSRASTLVTRNSSRQRYMSSSDDGFSESGSTSYEVPLENDFVSESVREKPKIIEGGLVSRKVQADDFEPLRCLGKGTFGTVLLVKQRATGRLYAQKQFKKASVVAAKATNDLGSSY